MLVEINENYVGLYGSHNDRTTKRSKVHQEATGPTRSS